MDLRELVALLDGKHPPYIFANQLRDSLRWSQQFPDELAEHILRDEGCDSDRDSNHAKRKRVCDEVVNRLNDAEKTGKWQDRGIFLPAFLRARRALESGAFSLRAYSVPVPFAMGARSHVRNVYAGLNGQGAMGGTWLPEVEPFVDAQDVEAGRKFRNAPSLAHSATLRLLTSLNPSLVNAPLWATLDLMNFEEQCDEPVPFKGDSVCGGIAVAAVAAAMGQPVGRDKIGDTAITFAFDGSDKAGKVGELDAKVDGILRENQRRARNKRGEDDPLYVQIQHLIVPDEVGRFNEKNLNVQRVGSLQDAINFLTFDEFRSYTDCLSYHSAPPLTGDKVAEVLTERGFAFVPYKHGAPSSPFLRDLLTQLAKTRAPNGNDLRWRRIPVPVALDAQVFPPSRRQPLCLGEKVCKEMQWVVKQAGKSLLPPLNDENRVETYLREGRFLLVLHGFDRISERYKTTILDHWLPWMQRQQYEVTMMFVGTEWDLIPLLRALTQR